MSEASKRRGDPIEAVETDEFHLIQDEVESTPLAGYAASSNLPTVTVRGALLPPGVSDVSTWSRTVCTLPKVEKMELTYAELVDKSKTDSDLFRYLRWVQSNGPVSGKVKDLADYLQASGYDLKEQHAAAKCFPGTSEFRKLK